MNKNDAIKAGELCESAQLLIQRKQFAEALDVLKGALDLDADSPQLHYNTALCNYNLGNLALAFGDLNSAIYLSSDLYPEALALLAQTKAELGDRAEGALMYQNLYTAIKSMAGYSALARNSALMGGACYLADGNFERGFALIASLVPPFKQDTWTGALPLLGKTLHVQGTYGMGDQIVWLRYIPILQALSPKKLIVTVSTPLAPVVRNCFEDVEVLEHREGQPSLEVESDYHIFDSSLGHIFKTTLGTMPNAPYLHFYNSPRAPKYPSKLQRRPKIGLICSGNPHMRANDSRSVPLKLFAPLLTLDFDFYLMQPESHIMHSDLEAKEELKDKLHIREFYDLAQTARALYSMDKLITVDSVGANLAGAMGLDIWVLTRAFTDWRWMKPWYPTARVFAQGANQQWEPVIARVFEELREFKL